MPRASILEEFNPGKPRNRIVTYLAEHGESSPYQISRDLYERVTDGYSTITQNIKELEEDGYVKFVGFVPSLKKGVQKIYYITPFLGLMLARACANNESKFLDREISSKEGYRLISEGFTAAHDVLGSDRFKKLLQESLLALQDEVSRKGKKMSLKKREERLLSLFIWPLLSEKTNEKEIIKLCRDSELMAGYVQDAYVRSLRILKGSGRLPSKATRVQTH